MDILVAEQIEKRFGPVRALNHARLRLRAGEIHALVGVNGAGKSTLSKIISGHYQKTSGNLIYQGEQTTFASPRDAMQRGVSIVLQETSIAPDLSVLENLMLPSFASGGRLDWRQLRTDAARALAELEATHLRLDDRAGALSMANRQLVEIARAMLQQSRVLILDEPTASLSPGEVQHLFRIMRKLRADGHALVFVSHRLEELFEISDCFTIMREGATAESDLPASATNPGDLVERMVGRKVESLYAGNRAPARRVSGEALLSVRNLAADEAVRDVSFTLERGQILGLGGLVGAGRTETLEAIFGLRKPRGGDIRVQGERFNPRHPRDAVSRGMALLTEDRRGQGLIPDLSLRENLTLPLLGQPGSRLRNASAPDALARFLADFDMPRHVIGTAVTGLSGGQQQKMLLARWLMTKPQILLLDEPTRGIDIGTRNHIYSIIRQCASEGVGVVVVSSDFEELLGLCDDIVVLSDGHSITTAPSTIFDARTLTMFAAPRSSSRALHGVLEDLSETGNTAAYWIDVTGGRVFCFDLVSPAGLDTGLSRSAFPRVEETRIPHALTCLSNTACATDAAGRSILFELSNETGHSFGWLGITYAGAEAPDAATVEARLLSALDSHGIRHLKVSRGHEHA
ncbi:sugar ABC transporter ATP-binding protein [Caballeronia sp. LZ035]|uniref:sugar ABC transporter ATP-binding protein n=1 Tax=Caballeronia sp. LZ035 TaxID=3038568 RepID=UPI0028586F76|nr:sugar ABC transporter ATP-binding protein [Caballeronia sp. LZ035]MDR5760542.1 sugar ABC transporter ATP-binding protein [Caballeronia sp. LZ035]